MQNYLKMIIASVCFLILFICIQLSLTENIDTLVYQTLHDVITSQGVKIYLDVISSVFSPLNCLFMILFILAVLFFYSKFKFWWYGLWCFSVFLIGTFLKNVIQRPRPSVDIDGFSFPSMHVLSVCLLVSLILLLKRNKVLYIFGIVLIISIMISRIYLQAHYFTDTIGSLLVMWTMIQAIQLSRQSDLRFYKTDSIAK